MGDIIIVEGDEIVFKPLGPVQIMSPPQVKWVITQADATGLMKVEGHTVVTPLDIVNKEFPIVATYTQTTYVTPGSGPQGFMITALHADQTSKQAKTNKQPMVLKGTTFQAEFYDKVKAIDPAPKPPLQDTRPSYPCIGEFIPNPSRKLLSKAS